MIIIKNVFIIGIGGVSTSSLALLLKNSGYNVSGSDQSKTDITINLEKNDIKVHYEHNKNNLKNIDTVIYTSAISPDNEEFIYAKENNLNMYTRSQFIKELCPSYKNVLCISGTHGKSTTTGLTSLIFLENNLDPTIMVGASLKDINGYLHIGSKDYLILETCEYKDSFLDFLPSSSCILNIDNDHLDYFKNLDNIKKSFQKFADLTKNTLIINNDDQNSTNIKHNNIITYGIKNKSNIMAKNITYDNIGHPVFDIYYNDEFKCNINLNIFGNHNIYNTLAAFAFSIIYNLDINKTKAGIEKYSGVKRRFEYLGSYNNALVFDDYAHHPTEINSTYESTKLVKNNKTIAIFQSHTFSRLYNHLNEFASILSKFDEVIIATIYPAREENIYNIKEEDLVNLIKKENNNVRYIDTFDKIVNYLKENVKENNLVISIGAGPVNKVCEDLLND